MQADTATQHKRKKPKPQNRSVSHQPTAQVLNLLLQQSKPTAQISVTVVDHSRPSKYNNIKTLQNLLLWLFTDKVHNPLWLSIKNQSKIKHCCVVSVEMEQSVFFDMMKEKRLGFVEGVFDVRKKAEFRDGAVMVGTAFWERLMATGYHAQQLKEPFKEDQKATTDEGIYSRYDHYTLTPDQLKQNLYPNYRLNLFKDYLQMNSPSPNNTKARDKILCLDCQMVSTLQGFELAKISVVNLQFHKLLDSYVKPVNQIENYNTPYSGITKEILDGVEVRLKDIQEQLKKIVFKDTILIGHSLENDLNALRIVHQKVIDTSVLFMNDTGKKLPLKSLASYYLKNSIQGKEHDSMQDTINTLALARLKIDILSRIAPQKKQIKFDVLEDLLARKMEILIVDEDTEEMFQKYEGVKCEKIGKDQTLKSKAQKIVRNLQSEKIPPKIMLTKFRYNQKVDECWKNYYLSLDQALQSIHQAFPPRTLFMFNFEINKSVPSEGINVNPFCLFATK